MSNPNTKFYHFVTYASLILCCLLSFFYSFIFSVVRDKDIQDYKVSEAVFVTNVYTAVDIFLKSYLTNSLISTFSVQDKKESSPKVKNFAYGYYRSPQGYDSAVFPDGSEIFEGDYLEEGQVLRITERALYIYSSEGQFLIGRRVNSVPKENKFSAKVQKPSVSEGSESAENNFLGEDTLL